MKLFQRTREHVQMDAERAASTQDGGRKFSGKSLGAISVVNTLIFGFAISAFFTIAPWVSQHDQLLAVRMNVGHQELLKVALLLLVFTICFSGSALMIMATQHFQLARLTEVDDQAHDAGQDVQRLLMLTQTLMELQKAAAPAETAPTGADATIQKDPSPSLTVDDAVRTEINNIFSQVKPFLRREFGDDTGNPRPLRCSQDFATRRIPEWSRTTACIASLVAAPWLFMSAVSLVAFYWLAEDEDDFGYAWGMTLTFIVGFVVAVFAFVLSVREERTVLRRGSVRTPGAQRREAMNQQLHRIVQPFKQFVHEIVRQLNQHFEGRAERHGE